MFQVGFNVVDFVGSCWQCDVLRVSLLSRTTFNIELYVVKSSKPMYHSLSVNTIRSKRLHTSLLGSVPLRVTVNEDILSLTVP